MSNYRGLNGTRLEQISQVMETSEELLDAIEQVAGSLFKRNDENLLKCSAAKQLWTDGGREDEILAALPIDSAEKDDEVFWGHAGKFAEFDGEKWCRE